MLNCRSILHSVKKQVQLHFSCTAVSSEDSSGTVVEVVSLLNVYMWVCIFRYICVHLSLSSPAYECQPGYYQCAGPQAQGEGEDAGCVPAVYLCDGHEDCYDGSDELGCDGQ